MRTLEINLNGQYNDVLMHILLGTCHQRVQAFASQDACSAGSIVRMGVNITISLHKTTQEKDV